MKKDCISFLKLIPFASMREAIFYHFSPRRKSAQSICEKLNVLIMNDHPINNKSLFLSRHFVIYFTLILRVFPRFSL
jgi:hypothetical protein